MTTTETRLHDLGYRGVSAPASLPLTEALVEAARLGTAAFARAHQEGRSIAPAQDAGMGRLIKRQQGDAKAVIALLDAFNKAYHAANQAQSPPARPAKLQWAQEGIRGFKATAATSKVGAPEYARALVMLLARLDSLSLTLRSDYYEAEPEEMTPENVREARDILAAGDALAEFLRGSVPVAAMEANKDAAPRLSAWAQMSKGAREVLRETALLRDGKRSVADRLDGLPGYIDIDRPSFEARIKLMPAMGTAEGPEVLRVIRIELSLKGNPGSHRLDTMAFDTRADATRVIEEAVSNTKLWADIERLAASILWRAKEDRQSGQKTDSSDLEADILRHLTEGLDTQRRTDLRAEAARLLGVPTDYASDPWSRALVEAGTFFVPGLQKDAVTPGQDVRYLKSNAAFKATTQLVNQDTASSLSHITEALGATVPVTLPALVRQLHPHLTHRQIDPKALHLPDSWDLTDVAPWQSGAKSILTTYGRARKKTAADMKVKLNTKAWSAKLKENAGSVGSYLLQVARIEIDSEKENREQRRKRIRDAVQKARHSVEVADRSVNRLRELLRVLGARDLPDAGLSEVAQVDAWQAEKLDEIDKRDWATKGNPRNLVLSLFDVRNWKESDNYDLDSLDADQMKLIAELREAGANVGLPG